MEKKADFNIQIMLFILMGIMFAWILIFGITKIFFVQETLSKQELVDLQNKVKETIKACDDPLNKGTKKTLILESEHFDSICFIGNAHPKDLPKLEGFSDALDTLNQAGDKVVMLKTTFESDKTMQSFGVVGSFPLEYDVPVTKCYFNYNGTNTFKVPIIC